ncbi:MAG: diacylglycerol kinase family protein [Chloroflexi bacterium]|nr:diacylglycerol kinase family protein [Chloroflexota bacterium]
MHSGRTGRPDRVQPEDLNEIVRKRIASFGYAFQGWVYALRTQMNTWIHATITTAVTVVGIWVRLDVLEWAIIVLAIGAVWALEFMNTAVEAIIDLVSPEPHPLAKVGKDVAAASVLVMAGAAAIVGFLILGPPLIERLRPLLAALLN